MSDNHVISIKPMGDGPGSAVMFSVPGHITAVKGIWIFLVEHLQPGFVVELSSFNGGAELTRPSGAKFSPELYAAVMGGDMD